MELIVFDLDGTLLNRESTISDYTSETLKLLSKREIAYTVATGRTLHGARTILEGHRFFDLPQAYKNGVMIWHPEQRRFSNSTAMARRSSQLWIKRNIGAVWYGACGFRRELCQHA